MASITPPPGGVEYVILTNDRGEAIGTAPKATVHTLHTPPHKAFSSFLFDSYGQLLITQRAPTKKTWGSVWTNSCCGHPMLGETPAQAAERRIAYELGMNVPAASLTEVLPGFRYLVERDGVVEREHCPVLVGFTDNDPEPNSDEVGAWTRIPWQRYVDIVQILPRLPTGTPKDRAQYDAYRTLFKSKEAYDEAHSIRLRKHGAVPLSEWSLWETQELLENETFKDLLRTYTSHGKR